MIKPKTTRSILFLGICLFFISALKLSAQDSLYIYKNGEIIYRSQTNQIDSAALHPPGYWAQQRSEVNFANLQAQSELSIFADMLVQTGYDKKLDDMTVWAPNNAALAKVDRSDLAKVRQLVENHLSQGLYMQGTTWMNVGNVIMLNQKSLAVTKVDNLYYLDNIKIKTRNIQKQSAQINILEQCIPIRPTLWEYIHQTSSTDSVFQFIRSYTKKTYNSSIKDSVYTNELITNVAASLKLETLEFTMLVPDDRLWNQAIDCLMQCYPSSTDPVVLASRLDNVKRVLLKDLFLQGKRSTLANDTLVYTTLGNGLENPTFIFGSDSLLARLSNGICLRINALPWTTPRKEVRVETESPVNRTYDNCRLITKFRTGTTDFPISNNGYIDVFPLTNSSIQKVWIQCTVPFLLPGKYNLYVGILPSYMEDSTKTLPNKLNFTIIYPNASGTTQTMTITGAVTNPKTISKLFLKANFELPFFDMAKAATTNPKIMVRIENAATSLQTSIYNREFLTDYILFEPVQP